jgi:hypothetical protein
MHSPGDLISNLESTVYTFANQYPNCRIKVSVKEAFSKKTRAILLAKYKAHLTKLSDEEVDKILANIKAKEKQ